MNKRMGNNFIINIGRQLGSGGREIGEKLAARLGIDFYDKELIRLASEESGLCCEFFEKADEKASQGIIGGLFGMRFPFVSDGAIPATNCLSNDALFKVQSDVIRRLAEEKSCLFVGVVPITSCENIHAVSMSSFPAPMRSASSVFAECIPFLSVKRRR